MLFFEVATMAGKFDSDRENGSGMVIDGIQYGQGECRGRLPLLSGTNDLLDADCAVIQNQLESRAIGAVATLYILFWNDTHGVSPATVTFDAQSGTAASPASTSVTYGATYGTLATTTRTGYTFVGWWTGAGGTGAEVTAATTVTITAAQTLYAKWTAGTSTVTFDAASGSVTPTSARVTFNAAYGLLPTPTRTGYAFAGWWTGPDGTGTQVTAATVVTTTVDQTLYANWMANNYTVTFDAQGGMAPSPASMSVTYGSAYGTLATTTRTGYTFGGWWTGAGGTGTQVSESSSFLIIANPILYATWVAISYIGPDFVITDIAITPELPAVGGHIRATVTVLNPSAQNGRGGHLYAWVDKPAAAAVGERGDKSVSIGTLKAGHSKTVHLSLIAPKSWGTFTLRAFVDARNVTNEDDEGNNQATYVYDTGLPNVEILEVWLSPAIPVAGKTFTAYVTVINSGEVAGNGGYLDLWADSSILAAPPVPGSKTKGNKYRAIGTLQPGQEKIIRVTGLRAPAGTAWTLGVLIDSRAKTLEMDETDNWFEFDYGASDILPPPPPPPG